MFFIKTYSACQRLGCENFAIERRGKRKKCDGKGCDSTNMRTTRRFSPIRLILLIAGVSFFIYIERNIGWPILLQNTVKSSVNAISEVRRLLLP